MSKKILLTVLTIAIALNKASAMDSAKLDLSKSYASEPLTFTHVAESLFQDLAPQPAPKFGAKDSARWSLHSGFALHDRNNALTQAGVGFEFFLLDNLSLEFQFNGVYVDQEGDDAFGAEMNVLFRWHFLAEEDWSVYLEMGAGIIWTTDNVPQIGSHLNFTPQAAVGISFVINPTTRVYLSAGYHHLSNAGIFPTNPSRDSIRFHMGISFPF